MSLVAGIDFSSFFVDTVLLDEDGPGVHWHRRMLGRAPLLERVRLVRDAMPARGLWADNGVTLIAIERPYSKSFKAASALFRIQGALLACLPRDIPVVELTPQQWKRETVGKTNASKDQVKAWALWGGRLALVDGSDTWPQDAFDAYAIAWAARDLDRRTEARAA